MAEEQSWRRYTISTIATTEEQREKAARLFDQFAGLLLANGLALTQRYEPVSGHRRGEAFGRAER